MKKVFFFATVVAMSLFVAMPVQAQSRKEKKAAEKANWEMEQQQKREEAELRHQIEMQKLRDAQAESQAAKEAAKQEAAERAAAKKQAEAEAAERAKMTAVAEMPCQSYDDEDWFYATGARRFEMNRISTTPAALLRSTQRQLLDKLKGKYKQVTRDYFDQMDTEEGSYEREHIESAGEKVINQLVNETHEVCRKQSAYPDAEGKYTMYMSIRISKKEIVEKVVDEISEDQQLKVRFNEKKFREDAFKVFEEFEKSAKEQYNNFVESAK